MYEIADAVTGWQQAGHRFIVARILEVEGFGRRWPTDALAVSEDARHAGSLIPGLVEGAVDRAAVELLADPGLPDARLLTVEASDSQAAATGLVCGGSATLLVQRGEGLPAGLWPLLTVGGSGVLFTTTSGPNIGASLLIAADGRAAGTLGDPGLDNVARGEVARLLRTGRSTTESLAAGDRSLHAAVLFPLPELVVVGDGQLAEALGRLAGNLEWDVSVLTGGDDDLRALAGLGSSSAVVVLTHDLALAAPSLAAALASDAGYVGAVGSRKTQAGRAARLRELGVADVELERIRGPAGLDLGGRTPAEIALSICAEVLAERHGRSPVPLSGLSGPIHQPDRGPDRRVERESDAGSR
jgi:xanthine dehydrogenase accessory factor